MLDEIKEYECGGFIVQVVNVGSTPADCVSVVVMRRIKCGLIKAVSVWCYSCSQFHYTQLQLNNTYIIQASELKSIAQEAFTIPKEFPLGAHVRSIGKYSQGFTGVVAGYELNPLRIVTISDKQGQVDRVRYSYLPSELEVESYREEEWHCKVTGLNFEVQRKLDKLKAVLAE